MQTISVPTKTFEKILSRLDYLTKTVDALYERLEVTTPPYGSDKWWDLSERRADEDIKAGRVSGALHTKEELQGFLDSLKTS